MSSRPRTSSSARAFGCLGVAFVVLVAGVLTSYFWLRNQGITEPLPGLQRCVATVGDASVALDLDQAHFASIIVGLSVRRKLPPRAASIAMATAYQETGIRNLDHGDRDSVGLFQQRPSQGWGSEKQLTDPYYATGKFYDALIKVKNWRTDDINDVAQKVQRSGYPEAYRDHEGDGRVLASTLTGEAPGGFSCLEREGTAGDAASLVTSLDKTLGVDNAKRDAKVVTMTTPSADLAWAAASHVVANSKLFGLLSADVAGRRWETDRINLPRWTDSPAGAPQSKRTTVTFTVR